MALKKVTIDEPIKGPAQTTLNQMLAKMVNMSQWNNSDGPWESYIREVYRIAPMSGIGLNPEVVIAQSMVETGVWNGENDRWMVNWNPAGIGVYSNNAPNLWTKAQLGPNEEEQGKRAAQIHVLTLWNHLNGEPPNGTYPSVFSQALAIPGVMSWLEDVHALQNNNQHPWPTATKLRHLNTKFGPNNQNCFWACDLIYGEKIACRITDFRADTYACYDICWNYEEAFASICAADGGGDGGGGNVVDTWIVRNKNNDSSRDPFYLETSHCENLSNDPQVECWWYDGVTHRCQQGSYCRHAGIDISYPCGGVDNCGVCVGHPIYLPVRSYIDRVTEWDSYTPYAVYAVGDDGYYYIYGHLNKVTVNAGQSYPAGTKIGEMGGMDGDDCNGHLHLETLVGSFDGTSVDPLGGIINDKGFGDEVGECDEWAGYNQCPDGQICRNGNCVNNYVPPDDTEPFPYGTEVIYVDSENPLRLRSLSNEDVVIDSFPANTTFCIDYAISTYDYAGNSFYKYAVSQGTQFGMIKQGAPRDDGQDGRWLVKTGDECVPSGGGGGQTETEEPQNGFAANARVVAKTKLNLRDDNLNYVATMYAGTYACVVSGPTTKDGFRRYKVRLSNGTTGWIAQGSGESNPSGREWIKGSGTCNSAGGPGAPNQYGIDHVFSVNQNVYARVEAVKYRTSSADAASGSVPAKSKLVVRDRAFHQTFGAIYLVEGCDRRSLASLLSGRSYVDAGWVLEQSLEAIDSCDAAPPSTPEEGGGGGEDACSPTNLDGSCPAGQECSRKGRCKPINNTASCPKGIQIGAGYTAQTSMSHFDNARLKDKSGKVRNGQLVEVRETSETKNGCAVRLGSCEDTRFQDKWVLWNDRDFKFTANRYNAASCGSDGECIPENRVSTTNKRNVSLYSNKKNKAGDRIGRIQQQGTLICPNRAKSKNRTDGMVVTLRMEATGDREVLINNGDLNPICDNDDPNYGYCNNPLFKAGDDNEVVESATLPCSLANKIGFCPDGFTCKAGVCDADRKPCSKRNPNGFCDEGSFCDDGRCKSFKCSNNNPNGSCAAGETCVNGKCKSTACSNDNPNGSCPSGEVCLKNQRNANFRCVSVLCSDNNPTGTCPSGERCAKDDGKYQCIATAILDCPSGLKCGKQCCASGQKCGKNNKCKPVNATDEPCSTTFPNGTCGAGMVCQNGSCVKPACSAAYPSGTCPSGKICRGAQGCQNPPTGGGGGGGGNTNNPPQEKKKGNGSNCNNGSECLSGICYKKNNENNKKCHNK